MLFDFKFALRQLLKSPSFVLIALLTLALGIGLNAAMFNIVNSLAFQPLKFPQPENLFRLEKSNPGGSNDGHRPAHFVQIARECEDIAQIVCTRPWSFTFKSADQPPVMLGSLRASAGYFHVLGLKMELGREFRADEDKPGSNRVVILSRKFWLSEFNGDRNVIGKTVRIDGEPNEIVGVAPAEANDARVLGTPQLYRPLALTEGERADVVDHAYSILGRYRAGVTPAQAESHLAAVSASLLASDPREYEGSRLRAVSLQPKLQGSGRQIVFMLIGLSAFVLVIACANLANLLLARAIARGREFAIRSALGASKTQLMRPLVIECVVLALSGGICGLLVCVWTNEWMSRQFMSGESPMTFVVDWRLLVFAFGASLCTAVFFGVVPAWVTSRTGANEALKSGTRGSTGGPTQNRFRQVLIVGQVALALVLLSGAVFFMRGIDQLMQRPAGWQPTTLLRGVLSTPSIRYPDEAAMMRFYDKVQQRVAAVPGVAAASVSHEVPAFGFPSGRGFVVQGEQPPADGNGIGAPINGVTPGYFNTVGTRLLSGRDFNARDDQNAPRVIVLNETMARTLFHGQDAIGRRIAYSDGKDPVWMEIVGIVQDVHFLSIGQSANFQAYVPLAQATWSYVMLTVRAQNAPAGLMDSVRRAVGEIDADMAVKDLMPVTAFIEKNMQDVRAINGLLTGFAVLGLLLAALGICGVISRLVAQRTNEIGIRMALGAQLRDVVNLILGSGMKLVLIGAALGVIGAVALTRFLISTVPGLATDSVLGTAAATALLILIAAVACYLPARRAAKVNPMTALRSE